MTTVCLINPSSPSSTPIDIVLIESWFNSHQMDVIWGDNVFKKNRFLAGTDAERIHDIMYAFANPEVDIIVALKGGYGSGRLLPLLDLDQIRANIKPFFGFSDTTALQMGFWSAGIPSRTGFSPRKDITADGVSYLTEQGFLSAVLGHSISYPLHSQIQYADIAGPMIAGTSILIEQMLGTPYAPSFQNAILVLEEVGEKPYQVDRILSHLELAGIFDKVQTVIFGQFINCISSDKHDGTITDVLTEWSMRIMAKGKSVFTDLPYGHGKARAVLPIGYSVTIKNNILQIK